MRAFCQVKIRLFVLFRKKRKNKEGKKRGRGRKVRNGARNTAILYKTDGSILAKRMKLRAARVTECKRT